jgi:hypothetical protein
VGQQRLAHRHPHDVCFQGAGKGAAGGTPCCCAACCRGIERLPRVCSRPQACSGCASCIAAICEGKGLGGCGGVVGVRGWEGFGQVCDTQAPQAWLWCKCTTGYCKHYLPMLSL